MRLSIRPIGIPAPVLTLEDAKQHLRQDSGDEDATIQRCINGAVKIASNHMDRALGLQTFAGSLHGGFGCGPIEIPILPVRSIDSVEYVDQDGVTQTMPDTDYTLIDRGEDMPAWLALAYGAAWPSARCQLGAVTVTLTAGYDDAIQMPDDIKVGLLLLVGHLFENREAVNTGNIVTQFPFGVEFFLGPSRVLRV
jgi:uncharacterized phiE125 gp8 family phage protein